MKELIKKICKIQGELKAPKNQFNNFGGYKYRSCEDILEAVKPLLSENGLVLTVNDEMVLVGTRVYVKATATITDGENSLSNSAYAREAESKKGMDDSQVTGATSSYARKYALNGLLCIDDTKDADATNTHGKEPEKTPAQKAQETKQVNREKFEQNFNTMYEVFKSGKVKWSYDMENRFNAIMKEAISKGYEPEKCSELLEMFDKLEKDRIVY